MSKLISVEGMDLAGKTSVIIPYLQSKLPDYKFVSDLRTGKIASKIRDIFMDPECINEHTDWRTIAFLSATARSALVTTEIEPALKAGISVISDRYVDTAFVYNLKSDTTPIDTILNLSTHLRYPDITIFAYCSYDAMVARKSLRDDNDIWDISCRDAYDDKLIRYREQLHKTNRTIIEINTTGSIEMVHSIIDSTVLNIL